jgi:hypothetical protein
MSQAGDRRGARLDSLPDQGEQQGRRDGEHARGATERGTKRHGSVSEIRVRVVVRESGG